MSVLAQSAARHYPIDDDWLDEFVNDRNRYVDIIEIRNQNSQYIQDLISMGKNVNVVQESQRACFILNGIRVGDTDGGKYVRGIMEGEDYVDRNKYAELIDHPERFKRIYSFGTEARHIWFVGYGQTYGNPPYSELPFKA